MFLLYGENDIFSDKQNPRVVRGFCVFRYRDSCHTVRIKSVISGRLLITNLITTAAVHNNTLNITTSMTSFAIFSRSINLSSGVMTGKISRCGVTGISASVMSVLLLLAKGIACLILCKKYFQNIKNLLNNCITKSWDYPHSHGEESTTPTSTSPFSGLPPLTWGRVLEALAIQINNGITPTRVGKSHNRWYSFCNRLGGLPPLAWRRNAVIRLDILSGLPPLAWGRANQPEKGMPEGRITPTRVGKRVKKAYRYCIFLIFCIMFYLVCEVISLPRRLYPEYRQRS